MSRPKPKPEQTEQPADEAAAPEPAEEQLQDDEVEVSEAAPAEEIEDPAARRIAELEAEAAGLKDQLLRALAEVENVRRRAQKERDDARRYAAAPLLKDLLAVADNLARAIEAVPAGDDTGGDPGDSRLATLLDGVKLTERELNAVFERHHIVKLEPLGEPLDPHRHEAMFEVPDPSQPSGTVVQVIQPGYLLHDRLLRAAQVGVAKGGPPASSGPEEAAPEDSATNGSGNPDPGSHVDTSA